MSVTHKLLGLRVLLAIFLMLTSEKVSAAQTVTYCIDPSWPPYEAFKNGEHIGISADYLKLIEARSNLVFELVMTQSWQQSLDFVQSGECMMLSMANMSSSRRRYLAFSKSYFQSPNVLVSKAKERLIHGYDGIQNELVGVVRGYRNASYIANYYPNISLRAYDNELEALQALENDEIEIVIGSILSVNHHIKNSGLDDLSVVGYVEPFDLLRFGVNKAYSDELIPVLNAAIDAIPETQHVKIYKTWNNAVTLPASRLSIVALLLGFLCAVVFGFACYYRYRWQRSVKALTTRLDEIEELKVTVLEKNRTIEFLSSHDAITGLYNRNQMFKRAEEEVSRFQRFQTPASMIIVELEHLNYQNNATLLDEILKAVSSLCLASVRDVDVVSRFGAQQFLIMCPQTDIYAAKTLSDRLLDAITESAHCKNLGITAGISVSVIQDGETFTHWYERTLQALKHNKPGGKAVVAN